MLRVLVIGLLLMHGAGHIMGFLAAWTPVPVGFSDRPWIFSEGVTMASPVGRAFSLLWLVAMVATVGAGLGLVFQQEWWKPLAVASAAVSLVAFIPWWNAAPSGSVWGAVLVDLLLIAALAFPWGEQVARALE